MLRARVSVPSISRAVSGEPRTLHALVATALVAVVLGIGQQPAAEASSPAVSPIPVGALKELVQINKRTYKRAYNKPGR
jgi:hypothetical protein